MRKAAVAVAAAAALLAAGCSSSSGGSNADDPVVSAPATSAAPSAPAVQASTPPAPATSAAPVSSAGPASGSSAPPTAAHSTPITAPPILQHSTCTKVRIRAIPGGASMGQEIAALQFTNDGPKRCQLVGYPSVTLLRQGQPVGRPSQPASTGVSQRTLAPGETAESLLRDFVGNCQAPLSDEVRVVAPGSTQTFSRPFVMRGCVLRVDRLGAPD